MGEGQDGVGESYAHDTRGAASHYDILASV
jgi:hypothetical protein